MEVFREEEFGKFLASCLLKRRQFIWFSKDEITVNRYPGYITQLVTVGLSAWPA